MKKHPKIILPRDPQKIGTMPNGEPIWFDPKDLVMTHEDVEVLADNRKNQTEEALVFALVKEVFRKAALFTENTFLNLAPNSVCEAYVNDADTAVVDKWLDETGFRVSQDGLSTIVIYGDRVVRMMIAEIECTSPRIKDLVVARVRSMCDNGKKQ